jgi:hypothetical protein
MPPRSDQRKDKILACDEVCFGFAFPEWGQQSTSFGETSAEDARHVHGGLFGHRHSCDRQHIQFRASHLPSALQVKGGCDMVADWIVIYAVLFVLAAAVVGRVPADT